MRIEHFTYRNNALDWQLERTSFGDLTLLVGISGVGKTQILHALYDLKRIAEGKSRNGIEWDVEFSAIDGDRYRWSGEFEVRDRGLRDAFPFVSDEDEGARDKPVILAERLEQSGNMIVDRRGDEIRFQGQRIPKLTPSKSIIALLEEEDSIRPTTDAFRRIVYSDHAGPPGRMLHLHFSFKELETRYQDLDRIRDSDLPTLTKLALVYRRHSDLFASISDRFIDIFPQVEAIKIEPLGEMSSPPWLAETPILQIRERNVGNWIEQDKISSGMLRVITHIAELYLWPEGTVILIDEFENSLGVNCIDVITDDLLRQDRRLQFILTSHHPYIINNISPKYWKVVTRKGGMVRTRDAAELRIGTSHHDAFLQLINSDTYREGIDA